LVFKKNEKDNEKNGTNEPAIKLTPDGIPDV